MSGEREVHIDQLISEGLTPEQRETTVTERFEDGVRRRYIDLGTVTLGGDYHGMALQGSPMIASGSRVRRRPIPRD